MIPSSHGPGRRADTAMLNCRMDYEQSFLRTLCSLMLMSTLPDCVMSDVNAFSDAKTGLENLLPSTMCLQNSSIASIYGIMFDAGSTGTRIHIYSFTQKYPDHLPELEREIFESVKPGLSTYADIPEQGAATIRELLEIAKNAVPSSQWKNTPVVLKATAGLRLLPEEKAKTLLSKVRDVFKDSPFLVPDKSVSIMNGTYEGILAWITVNFLTGQLYSQSKQTLGILDLGGASTQITFLPQSEETIEQSPLDFITSFKMFQSTYKLYTHSYLGLGLKAARLATLGAVETGATDKQIFRSSCFPEHLEAEWQFGGVSYRYGGIANDYNKGGIVEVKDFERKAIEVCDHMESFTSNSPFLCMDLSYITALLKEGFGFEARTPLQLRKKVNNVETGWTLGATFLMLQSLRISH
ncbi:ectonucleoside triphosphate diphosphohydrolase 5 isoform X3 [Rhinatrema bivittatum]|uniref:ectonucleoside triphosphate diphosphohydrolase 5 isoform X3 n=1 Tax=Rhinatrema bivittatum TaxID=194408 RepID=UPI00112D24B4|nr:ectonucleoside triphosphate diphosphohydrolase 5 isoform X3 [Rhinatrema bivittatum]